MSQCNQGVSNPTPPPPVENPAKKPVTFRFSIFFDGTGNNRDNIRARKEFESGAGSKGAAFYERLKRQHTERDADKYESFNGDYSNVAIMEEDFNTSTTADRSFSIYIEGAGTQHFKDVQEEFDKVLSDYQERIDALAPKEGYTTKQSRLRARARKNLQREQYNAKAAHDSIPGGAFAIGVTGIEAKSRAAFNKISKVFKNKKKFSRGEEKVAKLELDVFGFSRGAATARYFAHQVLKGQRTEEHIGSMYGGYGHNVYAVHFYTLKQQLEQAGVEVAENAVTLNFVGLYDTVSSHRIALTSDVKSLGLRTVKEAKDRVVHLASAEEHRMCFSLSTIKAAINAGVGEEYYLPGVHSDIGGGYRDYDERAATGNEEMILASRSPVWRGMLQLTGYNKTGPRQMHALIEQMHKEIDAEGWYASGELTIRSEAGGLWDEKLYAKRKGIRNGYRLIAYEFMVEKSKKYKLEFFPKFTTRVSATEKDEQLRLWKNNLRSKSLGKGNSGSKVSDWMYKTSDKTLNDLRKETLHCSARVFDIDQWGEKSATGFWPRIYKGRRFRKSYDG